MGVSSRRIGSLRDDDDEVRLDTAFARGVMDGDPQEEPCDVDQLAGTSSRKHASLPADAYSEDTELYSALSDEYSDDGTSTVKPVPKHQVHTILFVAEAKTDNLRLLNKQAVSAFLEATVPGGVKDVSINSRRNILAIDVEHRSALVALRKIASLQDIKVRAHATPYGDTTIGVIHDIDMSIPENDLPILIKPADEGIVIRQASDCSGDTLKCANCEGPHDASSKKCPRMKREVAVLNQMVRDHSTHKEAAATVEQRRRHRLAILH
ncbi:hypothetical protein HPB48_005429 [Haemaphysalis longicornis]|uniref:Uncharacterized protein n=1 Tax=Haemaphysalis longicornis TaxID=44386 RepID=A0A9J6GHW9_HAELO|nr:hypothetical protein HPB48_005429 [Haemaphysalis longicornis]